MSHRSTANILVFSPSVSGGIAEYTFYQATALKKCGAKVACLMAPSFLNGRPVEFETITGLGNPPATGGSRLLGKIKKLWLANASQWRLAWEIGKRRPDLVLLDSYVEYFSPLWIWPHYFLMRVCGVRYAANLHDPERNFVIGPVWWHQLSVRLAYLPINFVLVHNQLPEPSPVPSGIAVIQVPHGLYEISGASECSEAVRQCWGVKSGQKVFLAFGYVRDGKNLDLAVRALSQLPDVFLVVAGSVASAKDRPFAYYRQLASQLGVAGRCHFTEGFVTNDELGKYFAGTDFVLLTYAATFHSQSGVLNLAARARKPVLASAAPGPLIESVRDFQLGITVEPDSLAAIVSGMQRLLDMPPTPRWSDYEASASWITNAQRVLRAADLLVKNDL